MCALTLDRAAGMQLPSREGREGVLYTGSPGSLRVKWLHCNCIVNLPSKHWQLAHIRHEAARHGTAQDTQTGRKKKEEEHPARLEPPSLDMT